MPTSAVDTRQLLSEAKFYESYSRFSEEKFRYETWDEAVDRVMGMHEEYYEDKLDGRLQSYIDEARVAYKDQLVLGAQRALQFGGPQILKHNMKLYNCTSSYADRAEFFGEIFYILLCGAGAGFSVQKHHAAKLPKIAPRNKQAKTHVIEDSIEGWAKAVDVLLSSYFVGGGKHPEFEGRKVFFDATLIRPKNSMISGGFKAPGPDGLRLALDRIEHLLQTMVLFSNSDILRPIDIYDIVMHIADAVLSGGVRRSATICLFSIDDIEMMNAKTGNWWKTNPQRGRSNNSAVIVRDEVTKEQFATLMKSTREFGEPGFIFVDSKEHTTNPCVEIGMFPQIDGVSGWQGCNLTEINGGACTSEEDFFRACRAGAIMGTLQAGYTDFKFLPEVTREIYEREALIGVSITGWMTNPQILFNKKILRKGAEIVKQVNYDVSRLIDINQAARCTCSKPSGNASVLLQTTSGVKGEHAKGYIRNAQMNKESEVVKIIAKLNPYMVEESVSSANNTDFIVSFPIIPNENALFDEDLKGIKTLEKVKFIQENWVEVGTNVELCADPGVRHNVSNTIIVDDWDEVEEYVFKNKNHFAGISFMADTGDKDFNQAPFTSVLSEDDLLEKYGKAAIFASGLIVDGLEVFDTLWDACSSTDEDFVVDSKENAMKRDWVRRYKNFAKNYLDGDVKKTEYCLKDVYLLHKWTKIQDNYIDIDWKKYLTAEKLIEIDTMGAMACAGGACDIDF